MPGFSKFAGLSSASVVGLSAGAGFSQFAGLSGEDSVMLSSSALLGDEYIGFALDFVTDDYSLRLLEAIDLIQDDPSGFAVEFISDTYAIKVH